MQRKTRAQASTCTLALACNSSEQPRALQRLLATLAMALSREHERACADAHYRANNRALESEQERAVSYTHLTLPTIYSV